MYLVEDSNLIFKQLNSTDWGIWGKEKYMYSSDQMLKKHIEKRETLLKQLSKADYRLTLGLRYTFGLSDLNSFSNPINEEEFTFLRSIYVESKRESQKFKSEAFKELYSELSFIKETADKIPGFRKGNISNTSNDPKTWRKYVYLDFFKFSSINILIRYTLEEIVRFGTDILTSRLIQAYFLGIGSFIEKASFLFDKKIFSEILNEISLLCNELEQSPEYPEIGYPKFYAEFEIIHLHVSISRTIPAPEILEKRKNERYIALVNCENYYTQYFRKVIIARSNSFKPSPCPIKEMQKLWKKVEKENKIEKSNLITNLISLRNDIDSLYPGDDKLNIDSIKLDDFYAFSTNPRFYASILEGKILGKIYSEESNENTEFLYPLFSELLPFYSVNYHPDKQLFNFDLSAEKCGSNLILTHHVHNADIPKLGKMMVINKLQIWDYDNLKLNISSSSTNLSKVQDERKICLQLGFNHYRLHARQHLKAGNQNRAIPNLIDGVRKEYYLTLDDDYFAFPPYAKQGIKLIEEGNLEYIQSPLVFKGIYEKVTNAELADAESMLFFELTFGRNTPRSYVLPRGTGTIFSFEDGKSTLSQTGGFLTDYSSEDFGQGILALIQKCKDANRESHPKEAGKMTDEVFVIGEGVDLNGKLDQYRRWMHGSAKVYFHLILKSLFHKSNKKLYKNRQFISIATLTGFGIAFRFLYAISFLFPFVFEFYPSKWQLVIINNLELFLIALLLNIISVSLMYELAFKQSNPRIIIRQLLLEPLITPSAIIGYIHGILGRSPNNWKSNKTKQIKYKTYLGISILTLLNLVAFTHSCFNNAYTNFWALINASLIIFGLFFLSLYRNNFLNVRTANPKLFYIAWIIISLTAYAVISLFLLNEFQQDYSHGKLFLLLFLTINFVLALSMTIINQRVYYKRLFAS